MGKIWWILIILLILISLISIALKNNSITDNSIFDKFGKILGLGNINEDDGGSTVAVLRGEIEPIENESYL